MAQQGEGSDSSKENSSGDHQQQQQQRQQEHWWERLLRSLGYRPGENNDVGVIGAVRQGLSDIGRIPIPGSDNDIYMFGNRDSNSPEPIFSDGMEGEPTPNRQSVGGGREPSQFNTGDYYNFGFPNSQYNSMYESLYNSPNTGFAPRGDLGNAASGGARFNQDRIPGENVGGGGGDRSFVDNTPTQEDPTAPVTNDQGEYTPYERRPLNIPSLSILNNVPFPQFTGGVQGMPTYNTNDYPFYQQNPNDIYRGGQNPQLSRYMPQMFDLGGKPINNTEGQGGYSYNLPNSFGPFPQFNSNYGQGFGGMWGGMPWNQPDNYGSRLFNRQERMGQGIAYGEQNPNTPPGFPMNSKPAIDPYYTGETKGDNGMGYVTGQMTDPTKPTAPIFAGPSIR